ncbi:hypothetical protein EJ08DRAFT_727914 [Tothia fuscella]|uniref:BAH domain-containing protein n=1 Tax=Tothia fuscella TaxID=1048955 RepID=A0A9P4NH36_9PEZI|nr:hypothetical protein EJ08DRAFT_727914 [Tothia fuscella]
MKRKSTSSASPRKRQKSATNSEQEPLPLEFTTRVVIDKTKDKKKADEAEYEPLVGELDANLDKAFYTVKPVSWNNLKKYKRFSIMSETFQVGDCILVKAAAAVDESRLPDTLKERWVAKALECRAFDEQAVYIRLVWFQRPEDLPGGRTSWHGTNELIASNDTQIIDANTVDGKVEVHHWNEEDDSIDLKDGELFWRQSYDMTKKTSVYSALRGHCSCNQPSNPDELLIRCENKKCLRWLHEECLVDDLATTLLGGEPEVQATENGNANGTSKSKKKGRKSEAVSSKLYDRIRVVDPRSEKVDRLPSVFRITPSEKGRPPFTVKIDEKTSGDNTVYRFVSTDMAGYSAKKPWEQEIKCLCCKSVID